ncbi:hypothetical protein ACFXKC_40700 [Streptomyces sp. NPDC059340]|uniref:hypothetical protein n=1 Tax=Streptomyces sp. NPDC059340 TaxID=3346806 RepID=UPI003698D542
MDFNDAISIVTAELTPQPWDYTTPDGTTLRVIPAGLREDAGYAEVLIRITRADATGLGEFGITGPDGRGVAEVGVTTTGLPALIDALTERIAWEDTALVLGALTVVPDVDGVMVVVAEIHGRDQEVTVSTVLPEAQRLPLASALRRALDVARGWES